jgi:hypothetical protein
MRRLLALTVFGLALALVASPAQAKGPEEGGVVSESLVISGPGLGKPLPVGGQLSATYSDLSNTFNNNGKMTGRPTAVTLGPRFEVLYNLRCETADGIRTTSFRQSLYPYATFRSTPQVWTFTAAGQAACAGWEAPPAGWVASRRGVFETLVSAGLPRTLPVSVPAPGPSVPRSWPWGIWVGLALAGLAIAAGTVTVVSRSRGRATI